MELLSIVVPCYNEEEALPIFYREVLIVLREIEQLDYELVFVDDGSRDGTLKGLRRLAQQDGRVKYLSFSRNFGKEAAMFAGMKKAAGDLVVIMDVDLQDPPSLLPQMVRILRQEGRDCVGTRRIDRTGEPAIRSFFARQFYRLINCMSDVKIVDGARDFRMMRRSMVDAILSIGEVNRFSKGIFAWVGFDVKYLEYDNIQRSAGQTKWSFWKLMLYSLDGIIAFSTVPLAISSLLGLLFCAVAFIMICVVVIKTLLWGDPVAGYPSLLCVIFFVGGSQLFCTGILGQYLSKAYLETKRRPVYITRETEADLTPTNLRIEEGGEA